MKDTISIQLLLFIFSSAGTDLAKYSSEVQLMSRY